VAVATEEACGSKSKTPADAIRADWLVRTQVDLQPRSPSVRAAAAACIGGCRHAGPWTTSIDAGHAEFDGRCAHTSHALMHVHRSGATQPAVESSRGRAEPLERARRTRIHQKPRPKASLIQDGKEIKGTPDQIKKWVAMGMEEGKVLWKTPACLPVHGNSQQRPCTPLSRRLVLPARLFLALHCVAMDDGLSCRPPAVDHASGGR